MQLSVSGLELLSPWAPVSDTAVNMDVHLPNTLISVLWGTNLYLSLTIWFALKS
jgi:hypothetical protein